MGRRPFHLFHLAGCACRESFAVTVSVGRTGDCYGLANNCNSRAFNAIAHESRRIVKMQSWKKAFSTSPRDVAK